MRTALTIAGSDSSGGAGIQADLKTFAAHGVFGMTAITAVTAQNTLGVTGVVALAPDFVAAQIDAVAVDIPPDATKIGMLANSGIIDATARAITRHSFANVVLDTVMIAKSRARLLDEDAVAALRDRLLPLAVIVTPNVPEAEALTGVRIDSTEGQREAARQLVKLGARAALVKGGHLEGTTALDMLWDGRAMTMLEAPRIDSKHTHGTGCTLSSAIAARLALGDDLVSACRAAKAYVTRAIAQAPQLGHGHGPLQHFPTDISPRRSP
jgi:hydroxymethylpyrimidine/phosphomethylpyrimidine kinase